MSDQVTCFLLTPSDRAIESLRRFVFSAKATGSCTGPMGYHDASVTIGEVDHDPDRPNKDRFPHDDPRWPSACECGYEFQDDDEWQHRTTQLWLRSDGGPSTTLRDAPPGAMWDASLWWQGDHHRGPDGRVMVLRLPNGSDWMIDGPSKNGNGWSRSGEPPLLTVQPSILAESRRGTYHGWLTGGVLKRC